MSVVTPSKKSNDSIRTTTPQVTSPTSHETIDRSLAELAKGAEVLASSSLDRRIALAEECLAGLIRIARPWAEAASRAKKSTDTAIGRAEDLLTGPIATIRYLHLILNTLRDLKIYGRPRLAGKAKLVDGQLRVPVFPTQTMFDSIVFRGLSGETWLDPSVTEQNLFGDLPDRLLRRVKVQPRVDVILGAGNVSSIPAADALTKVFQEDAAVLLKMNPVNQYVGPLFEDAFKPLIQEGWLRIVYGAAAEGAYAINHDAVCGVHITGSADSHEAIVWGGDPAERERRKQQNQPLLNKPITSELGNVTPWIIVPGLYTDKELASQAESIAASITNNASFNCVATKMIVTWKSWGQREKFLSLLDSVLRRSPPRFAYYPGAETRYGQFSGRDAGQASEGCLPWTLRKNVRIEDEPLLFQRESFVCVTGETQLDSASPTQFLDAAVDFVNERMTGTLGAELTVTNQFQKQDAAAFDRALKRLRYGTIGVNQWAAFGYAWMSPPWGGYPGATLANVESGIGSVHNTYLLNKPQKSILRTPLLMSPKPVWFSTHKHPDKVASRLLDLYAKPSILRLPSLFAAALTG